MGVLRRCRSKSRCFLIYKVGAIVGETVGDGQGYGGICSTEELFGTGEIRCLLPYISEWFGIRGRGLGGKKLVSFFLFFLKH